ERDEIAEEQENVVAVEKKLLEEDIEKLVDGKDEESYASEFADSIFYNEEDSCNRIKPESHKENPEPADDDDDVEEKKDDDNDDNDDHNNHALVRNKVLGSSEDKTEKMHTSIPSPPRSPRKDLSLDICLKRVVADIVIQERDALQAQVPDLISKEFVVQAPTIIKERFKMHMKNNVINIHPTTSTSNATTTADEVLKRKFEKSSTSSIPYRTDAFRKRDHDDYHEDDA
ncbi:hypothetical protein Tco_1025782, partial [Tanacetum coccineum]